MLREECTREVNDWHPALPHRTPQKTEENTPFPAPCKQSKILAMTLKTAAKIGQNQDSLKMVMKHRNFTIPKEQTCVLALTCPYLLFLCDRSMLAWIHLVSVRTINIC